MPVACAPCTPSETVHVERLKETIATGAKYASGAITRHVTGLFRYLAFRIWRALSLERLIDQDPQILPPADHDEKSGIWGLSEP